MSRSEVSYECPEFLPFDGQPGVCSGCGSALTGRQKRWCKGDCQKVWVRNHDWGSARSAVKRRDGQQCTREGCEVRVSLEVNHIEPRVGRGYGWGCHNHLTNLETLCHDHHVEVTRQQAAERSERAKRLHRGRFPESYPIADPALFDVEGAAS